MDVTVLNTNRQVEMGEWVVCVLQQNFSQVTFIYIIKIVELLLLFIFEI